MSEVVFAPTFKSWIANDVSPIPTTETTILEIFSTNPDKYSLQKHTQFSISGTCAYGSLTNVYVKIYWKRERGYFPLSVSSITGNVVNLYAPAQIKLPNGDFSFTFGIEPNDGIKITIVGEGTNTGSSLTNFELSVRTN